MIAGRFVALRLLLSCAVSSGWHFGHTIGRFVVGDAAVLSLIRFACIGTAMLIFAGELVGAQTLQHIRGWRICDDVLTKSTLRITQALWPRCCRPLPRQLIANEINTIE